MKILVSKYSMSFLILTRWWRELILKLWYIIRLKRHSESRNFLKAIFSVYPFLSQCLDSGYKVNSYTYTFSNRRRQGQTFATGLEVHTYWHLSTSILATPVRYRVYPCHDLWTLCFCVRCGWCCGLARRVTIAGKKEWVWKYSPKNRRNFHIELTRLPCLISLPRFLHVQQHRDLRYVNRKLCGTFSFQ